MTPATWPFSPLSVREEGASCLMFGLGQETRWGRDPGPQGQRCKGLSDSYSLGTVPLVFGLALLVAFNPSSLSGNKIFKQKKGHSYVPLFKMNKKEKKRKITSCFPARLGVSWEDRRHGAQGTKWVMVETRGGQRLPGA